MPIYTHEFIHAVDLGSPLLSYVRRGGVIAIDYSERKTHREISLVLGVNPQAVVFEDCGVVVHEDTQLVVPTFVSPVLATALHVHDQKISDAHPATVSTRLDTAKILAGEARLPVVVYLSELKHVTVFP